jgi:hypothetical protein
MTAFSALPATAAGHFQLRFFRAVLLLRERVPAADFPFLTDYCADLDAAGLGERTVFAEAIRQWEAGRQLPLLRLGAVTGLDDDAIDALFLLGLINEDARFSAIFEHYIGQPRPSLSLLHAWWPQWRGGLRHLIELGLVAMVGGSGDQATTIGPETPVVPAVVWDVLRGERPLQAARWARYSGPDDLVELQDIITAPELTDAIHRLPGLLEDGLAKALVVTGPEGSGRHTLVGAVARARGRGVLEITDLSADDPRWEPVGVLSTLLDAVPVGLVEPGPGESYSVPELPGRIAELAVVARRRSGVRGPAIERSVSVELGLPAPDERARHWSSLLESKAQSRELAARFRMTGGCIRRVGMLADAEAAFAGRAEPVIDDIAKAAATVRARLLDPYATRVATRDSWHELAVSPTTMRELRLLEARCRHRERLADSVGTAAANGLTSGVRALLSGPSGTGKTLAARALAGVLGMDLWRLDLSSVVNKYLGETEKNLERAFTHAEEVDVALLIDEGDALLTQRTAVRTSNDRYANLETNFLLQRLESFEGILIITTNAGERIDDAFRRRIDVVIDFPLPDETQRWTIWQLHLPTHHVVPFELLDELAERCALTGGQIRNAVLHAGLLALDGDGTIGPDELAVAVRREYVKSGGVCPLTWEVCVG